MASVRKAALAFIFVTVALDVLALGMVIPVLPKLIVRFLGGDTAKAALVVGIFVSVFELMQFLFSPVIGVLSDRFGRRPVVLLSNLGLGLDYLFMAVAPSLGLLFVGRLISGITSASFATAFAYIADVTPPEKRSAGFGFLGAAFGLGFIVGPALGGVLAKVDPSLPFWAAAVLSLTNAVYGFFILPESLAPEHRMRFQWKRANPVGSFMLLRSHPTLLRFASCAFAINLGHFALQSTFVLYAGFRYDWDERAVGIALGVVGVCSAIVNAALVHPIVKRIGEHAAILIGTVAGFIAFAVYGWAPTGALFCIGIPIMAFWALTGPSLQTLMSKHVGPSEQGQLQGAIASIQAIAGIVAPPIYSRAFSIAVAGSSSLVMIGAPFYIAAGFLAVAFALAWKKEAPVDLGEPALVETNEAP